MRTFNRIFVARIFGGCPHRSGPQYGLIDLYKEVAFSWIAYAESHDAFGDWVDARL